MESKSYHYWAAYAGGGFALLAIAGACLLFRSSLPLVAAGVFWSSWLSSLRRFFSKAEADEEEPCVEGAAEHQDDILETHDLVRQMFVQNRCALLLRPQIAADLEPETVNHAHKCLEDDMAFTPEGAVFMESWRALNGNEEDAEEDAMLGALVHVTTYYLDRHTVTNQRFQKFVDAGGYEDMSLWDPEIWPAVLSFIDQTDHPGPRFWRGGRHLKELQTHPVVGVCWYEAAAYSRWVGTRLPTDPEWVKAASWPVSVGDRRPVQRKFPWGDTPADSPARLWASDGQSTVGVDQHPEGATVGGVLQMVGNVWEWTADSFGAWEPPEARIETNSGMRSIRGGAFDTYFANQAACQFQSGENPLSRRRNIGFRCALGAADLATTFADFDSLEDEPAAQRDHQLTESTNALAETP